MSGDPFGHVRLVLTYADGKTEYLPVMTRWWAEWLLANEIASGYYRGHRVFKAILFTV
ncbi:MAG: hypothetical protein V1757_04075 [Actinomycetota bacterium]